MHHHDISKFQNASKTVLVVMLDNAIRLGGEVLHYILVAKY